MVFAAAVSLKRGHITGATKKRFCETQGIVVAVRSNAQGIVVTREWKKLRCAVFHVFSRVEFAV